MTRPQPVPASIDEKSPPRVVNYGPYGTNVDITENIGQVVLNVHAGKLYVVKGKLLFFDNALNKKLKADDLTVTLFHKNKKLLSFHKQDLTLPVLMDILSIDSPTILHPESMAKPDTVTIDKNKRSLTIQYKDKTEIWDLESFKDQI